MEVGTSGNIDECDNSIKVINVDTDAQFSNSIDSDDLGLEQKRVFDKSDSLLTPSNLRKFANSTSFDFQINGQSLMDDGDSRPSINYSPTK